MKKRIFSLLVAAAILLTLLPQLPLRSRAHQIVMSADEFISCLWTAYNRPNVYRNSYPYNLGYYDGSVIYFDCWNLGKAIIWSKGAIVNNYTVGHHATMDASCGLGDWDGLTIVKAAPNCSSDFTNLVPGEWLYMENHTGYYIGNGQVIECTAGWNVWGITISQIDQYGRRSRNGVSNGYWELHGMVPWLDYSSPTLDGHQPVDLGDDFYAYVRWPYSGAYMSNSGGNMCVRSGLDDNANQLFRFVKQAGSGAYSVGLADSSLWMDVNNNDYSDFSSIRMNPGHGSYSQKFYIYYINGKYILRTMFNNKVLAVDGSSNNICLYGSTAGEYGSMEFNARGFEIYKVNMDDTKLNTCIGWDFYGYIRHSQTGLLMTAVGDNVLFQEPVYSEAQKWHITRNEYGGHVIRSAVSGKVLDVQGASLDYWANIDLYQENGQMNQSFFVIPQDSYWYIKPSYTNTLLSIDGSTGEVYSYAYGNTPELKALQQFDIIAEDHFGSDEVLRSPATLASSFTAQLYLHGSTQVLTEQGNGVAMTENTYADNQYWTFIYDADTKAYKITGSSGKIFDAKDGGYWNNVAMVMSDSCDSLSQRFRLYETEYGYILSPAHTQKLVDVAQDGSIQLNQTSVAASRLFDLAVVSYNGQTPVDFGESFTSTIQNMDSGLFVTASNKTPLVCTANGTQWTFTRKSDGSYTVTSSGKALEVAGGSVTQGANVQMYEANGTRAQDYFIYPAENGYVLMSAKSGNVLNMDANTGELHIYSWLDTATAKAAENFLLEGAPVVAELILKEDADLAKTGEGYLTRAIPETPAGQIIAQFENENVTVRDTQGNEVAADAICGTGYTVNLTVGDKIVDTLELVIAGDVGGSGQVDVTDYMRVRAAMLGSFYLDGACFRAGDVDSSGYINTTDYMRIRAYFLGTYELYE